MWVLYGGDVGDIWNGDVLGCREEGSRVTPDEGEAQVTRGYLFLSLGPTLVFDETGKIGA